MKECNASPVTLPALIFVGYAGAHEGEDERQRRALQPDHSRKGAPADAAVDLKAGPLPFEGFFN